MGLLPACVTESAGATLAFGKFIDDFEVDLCDRHEDHLCDAITDGDIKGRGTSVPYGNEDLSLIV